MESETQNFHNPTEYRNHGMHTEKLSPIKTASCALHDPDVIHLKEEPSRDKNFSSSAMTTYNWNGESKLHSTDN